VNVKLFRRTYQWNNQGKLG